MTIASRILNFLKCIALVVGGLLGPFVIIVGPIRLAEMSPDYEWVRYAPIAIIFVIFCIVMMVSKKRQADNESKE